MFNIGAGEMVLICVAALLILGPTRLPELARGIGKFMREFRRQTDEVRNVVEREFYTMDQEISRDPTPPIRPGTPFAHSQPSPVALPEPPQFPTPEAGVAAPVEQSPEAGEPGAGQAPGHGTQVLELDATGPRQLEPSFLREPEPSAPGTPLESSAPAEPAPFTPDAPVPVPGTVARNAPKRS
ncbi:twin-arginine translocase TatA/TatE family subunit [Pyxidicoccus trucidator]|uniref:twin-arginine translocase TatA/TatE family subunit n=1 Tax=Pyxidicoccus trucidator TaxID=2709662 RepID=UPI0013DCA1AD|nr:twin-arginine translocase TatA/TatE family subunit [Pyxidicoccus trucidator]